MPVMEKRQAIDEPMLLAGAWVHRTRAVEVRDPEDGRLLWTVPYASVGDVDRAIEAAFRARPLARGLASHERARILAATADQVAAEAEDFARTIASEGIKTIREARQETMRCVATLRLAAGEATRLEGETIAFDQRPGSEGRSGYFTREPVGVIVAITPFNDPLNLVAHKVAPAIAAGNTVIVKPHLKTPLSALKLARAFLAAGLPAGILQVLTGHGGEIGDALVSDDRVRMVSFTGGRTTGDRIAARAGLKKLSMELGSNCPTIVMADADLQHALQSCLSGAYWAAGQNCLHVQRIYVEHSVYEPFARGLTEGAGGYRTGPKLDEATDMGCLIDAASAERIGLLVRSAVSQGAQVLSGGRTAGTHMEPTLMAHVAPDHPLVREETYGPVTVLTPVRDLGEAIGLANGTNFGLQAAIFTADLHSALDAVDRLEAGAVMVNDSTDYRMDAMPFGGLKNSGIGREGVRHAMLDMTEMKVACFNRRAAASPPPPPSQEHSI